MSIITDTVSKVGKAAAHALFPNDFEYYAVTLELTNSKGRTLEYLTFPVSPDNISYDDNLLVNIKKTLGGITATDSDTNRPKKITMRGTFGRKLRLLTSLNNLGPDVTSGFTVLSKSPSIRLKTGYGVTKIFKRIIEKTSELDEFNEVRSLYLYFPILGENYVVKPTGSMNLTQDITSSNMIWNYNIEFTVLAKIEDLKPKTGMGAALTNSLIQVGVNGLMNKVKSLI